MPPAPQLPYKRPFFTLSLSPHEIEVRGRREAECVSRLHGGEISPALASFFFLSLALSRSLTTLNPPLIRVQEDLALIITNTKRAGRGPPRGRTTPPPASAQANAAAQPTH